MRGDPPERRAAVLVGHATRLPGKFDREVDGTPVLERALKAVRRAGFRPTIVATAPRAHPDVDVILDRYDRGPLGGVRAFLETAPGPFLLVGGDMPFLDSDALRRLNDLHRPGLSIVPRWNGGELEVLHAMYDLDPASVVRCWEEGRPLRDLVRAGIAEGSVRTVPAEAIGARSFTDLDTVEDWERLA